jgi:hypothetical protein
VTSLKDKEAVVTSAVREFAEQLNTRGSITSDMSPLVRATNELPLKKFDYWERLIRWEYSAALRSVTPSVWPFRKKPKRQLTWIDLSSGNGYERETTLRAITGAGAPNSFFFVLAVRRLNDWVPQVRETARETLPRVAESSNAEHVVDALCSILPYWVSWGRLEEADKNVFFKILAIEKVSIALKNRIIEATNGPMAMVLSQAGRTPVLDSYLNDIAQSALQPAARAKAYRGLLEGKMSWSEGRKWVWTDIRYCEGRYEPIVSERELSDTWPFKETLKQAAGDKSSIVRRVAGEFLIRNLQNLGSDSMGLAKLLANDSSPAVSERGVFALKKLQEEIA